MNRFARFLFGDGFLRNIIFNHKLLVTLRAGAAAEENRIHHCPDYQRRMAVRTAEVQFPVRQFDFSPWSGHRCIKAEMRKGAKRGADLKVFPIRSEQSRW